MALKSITFLRYHHSNHIMNVNIVQTSFEEPNNLSTFQETNEWAQSQRERETPERRTEKNELPFISNNRIIFNVNKMAQQNLYHLGSFGFYNKNKTLEIVYSIFENDKRLKCPIKFQPKINNWKECAKLFFSFWFDLALFG